jgi:hypothetical protein
MKMAKNVVQPSLVALALAGCLRSAESSAPRPAATRARSASATEHPVHERKPDTGARIELVVTPLQDDRARARVTITATRPMPESKLRIAAESPLEIEGEAAVTLPPLQTGASLTRFVHVRRAGEGQRARSYGSLLSASVTVESAGESVTDQEVRWVFGPPDPARVLERSSLELGEQGVGPLGPNDRVVRTPEGERVHESIVQ